MALAPAPAKIEPSEATSAAAMNTVSKVLPPMMSPAARPIAPRRAAATAVTSSRVDVATEIRSTPTEVADRAVDDAMSLPAHASTNPASTSSVANTPKRPQIARHGRCSSSRRLGALLQGP